MTVPMILYPPKVSSEHLVDDVGTRVNHHRNDPKVIILTKSAAFSSKIDYILRNKYALFSNTPVLFSNTPVLFLNTPALFPLMTQ